MAQLWAEKIMKAETEYEKMELYKKVPRLLKEKVKAILETLRTDELMAE